MTKQEAADFLECSVRQLERYTSENRIGVKYTKGKTRPTPTYEESEVAAFKAALETPVYRGVVTPAESRQLATQSDSGLSQPSQLEAFEAMARVLTAAMRQNSEPEKRALTVPEIAAKPLLKLDEAALLTGLSRATLRAAIDAGELSGRQIGRAWRIKRGDLDSYIEKL